MMDGLFCVVVSESVYNYNLIPLNHIRHALLYEHSCQLTLSSDALINLLPRATTIVTQSTLLFARMRAKFFLQSVSTVGILSVSVRSDGDAGMDSLLPPA